MAPLKFRSRPACRIGPIERPPFQRSLAGQFRSLGLPQIYSAELDQSIKKLGLRVLKSPYRSPLANCICERVIGTLRRECLDFMIPLTQLHLLRVLKDWVSYYNASRPHMPLGPGIPSPPGTLPLALRAHRHRLPEKHRVFARPVLGGLHHDYRLVPVAL